MKKLRVTLIFLGVIVGTGIGIYSAKESGGSVAGAALIGAFMGGFIAVLFCDTAIK